MSASIVLIGPAESLPSMRERLDSGAELHTFTDHEALEALDHIIRHKPRIIALDEEFSATSRGTALIRRIKDDGSLETCEVRVVAHDTAGTAITVSGARGEGDASGTDGRKSPDSNAASAAGAAGTTLLDARGTRRAPRYQAKPGVEVLVDGNPAVLIDVSAVGLQVISSRILKPNQRVRLTLSDGDGTVRCSGAIAWAAYEMPREKEPHFRAGIEIGGKEAAAISAFAARQQEKAVPAL